MTDLDFPADPGLRSQAYHRIAATLAWLCAHPGPPPTLAEMAAQAGLSPGHFQRVFTTWAGLSPKRFLQQLARERAREALLEGADLLSASLAAGLSGPGRLHDLLVTCEAATPGEIKSGGAGLQVRWGVAPTPFGPALLAQSARGLMAFSFLDEAGTGPALARLQQDWPAAQRVQDTAVAAALAQRLFARYQRPQPLALFVKGTQFQLRVWEALLRVPEGRLVSYGTLARHLGQPGAGRAVGAAVGANPIALLIPCHRVIRNSGVLGEYRWGAARKRLLVAAELAWHAPEEG